MNNYETVFILTPVLSEAQTKEAVDKFKKLIKKGAKLSHDESWGLKKLAYPIQKKSTGFYYLFEFEAEGDFLKNFEVELKRDEKVMRFLTIKMNNDHLKYSVKRRDKMSDKIKA
jgi:small subunit ribosomal protein S6